MVNTGNRLFMPRAFQWLCFWFRLRMPEQRFKFHAARQLTEMELSSKTKRWPGLTAGSKIPCTPLALFCLRASHTIELQQADKAQEQLGLNLIVLSV